MMVIEIFLQEEQANSTNMGVVVCGVSKGGGR